MTALWSDLWERLKRFELSASNSLILGALIGFIPRILFNNQAAMLYYGNWSDMASYQMGFAIGFSPGIAFMILLGIGLFMKDDWKLKVLGGFIVYWALLAVIFQLLTIKPYVMALKDVL